MTKDDMDSGTTNRHDWEAMLGNLEPVDLKGLDRVKLMNRVDSKYVFDIHLLDGLLAEVSGHYQVLEIDSRRIFTYHSIYLDTPGFTHYHHHHNGKVNRVKLRYRKYVDHGATFFEVKLKTKGTRTDKHRIALDTMNARPGEEELALLRSLKVPEQELEHKVLIHYRRITLAAREGAERVTLDLQLSFHTENIHQEFPTLVIAEIKQDRFSIGSPFIRALKARHVGQLKISKYALAVALTQPHIKANQFKRKVRKLTSILQKHGTYRTA